MNRVSCIVCAYNEAERIRRILEAVSGRSDLHEVIVVDDGSTDATAAAVNAFPGVRLISYPVNRGKTYAMAQGVAAACGDYLLFLDADLDGVEAEDIGRLLAPVQSGGAEVTMSLRSNSLPLYRWIGLDFVTGERVVPAWLLRDRVAELERLPRWGAEVFINDQIIAAGLRLEVVAWPGVANVRKYVKFGAVHGLLAEIAMVGDAFRTLPPDGVLRQNLQLLRLAGRFQGATAPGFRRLLDRRKAIAWPGARLG